ncbi:SRPBCC family protein [Tsukamurella sp. 1534]|uniref:SRPBCC family protein n=1 Tax=Tsukamurella sp. 1534 TaxID=1151061 RepID=UPI0002ED3FF6|nr:SRPBCC family protein [Tsukamurella sp. 1534]
MSDADRTRESIVIAAPADTIMDAISAFDRYPEWVSAAREVTVLDTTDDGRPQRVRFVLEEGFLRDTYELEYTWEPGGRSVEWELAASTLQSTQHGRYDLTPTADGTGTTVTYTLEVTLQIPMLGMLRRKAEKAITDTALKELKRHVEGERAAGS